MTQNIDIANPQLFTVLVNSSDGFEDCWDPFFKLFDKYWPNCNAPIILNTEKKTYKSTGTSKNPFSALHAGGLFCGKAY